MVERWLLRSTEAGAANHVWSHDFVQDLPHPARGTDPDRTVATAPQHCQARTALCDTDPRPQRPSRKWTRDRQCNSNQTGPLNGGTLGFCSSISLFRFSSFSPSRCDLIERRMVAQRAPSLNRPKIRGTQKFIVLTFISCFAECVERAAAAFISTNALAGGF